MLGLINEFGNNLAGLEEEFSNFYDSMRAVPKFVDKACKKSNNVYL